MAKTKSEHVLAKPGDMQKLTVRRFRADENSSLAGFVEPKDKSWRLLIMRDGSPVLIHVDDRPSDTEVER